MRSRIYKLGALLVILLLAVGGCRKAGTWLVKDDHPEHVDAMIMLMGSMTDRVPHVADLYREKIAGKVWIVQAEMTGDIFNFNTLTNDALIELGIPSDSIVTLPGGANSTRMEAEIIRDYLATQTGIDTLLVVTSSYHTRRAFLIFQAAFSPLEESVVLYCSPSSYSKFHADRWWRYGDDIGSVVLGYMKMLNFYLFERRALRRADLEKL